MSETKLEDPLSKRHLETITAKAFEITSADGGRIAIPAGEFYFNTKARGRRMMLDSLSSEARQVYACLELSTMGFQQELAVVMEKGAKRPMTPADIGQQTGLSKQHVRRALVELEDEGLAERRSDDGGALRNGHMLLYSWAVPREANPKKVASARLPFPSWFPHSWDPLKPLINRLKLSVSISEGAARDYLDEGDEAARTYQEAEMVAARFLERICARPPLYKEERTERTSERTNPSPTPSLPEGDAGAPPSAELSDPPTKPFPIEVSAAEDAGKLEVPSEHQKQWEAFRTEALAIEMECTEAEEPYCRSLFLRMPVEKRIAATDGIRERVAIGQYDRERRQVIPSVRNYLLAEKWTAPPRPPLASQKKAPPDTTYLDLLQQGFSEEEALRIVKERKTKAKGAGHV